MISDECPDDWFRKGKRCYYFVEEEMDWWGAYDNCMDLNDEAELAILRKRHTIDKLDAEMTRRGLNQTQWLLGGYMIRDQWRWVNSKVEFAFIIIGVLFTPQSGQEYPFIYCNFQAYTHEFKQCQAQHTY